MKLPTTILLVSVCLASWTSSIHAVPTVPEIANLFGPPSVTTMPPVSNGTLTNPTSTNYTSGTTSRLALYVPGTVWSTYPGWLPLYKALVVFGIPVRVTTNITVATTHSMVLAYQSIQSAYLGATDAATWSSYVAGGKTLVAVGLNTNVATLTTLFGVTVDAKTNSLARSAIQLNAPKTNYAATNVNSQFNTTDERDGQIPLWAETTNVGFPTIGYTLQSSSAPYGVAALGTYVINSSDNLDTKHGITVKSNAAGGKAIAIGIDLGAYVGLSNGGRTGGIPRSYAAEYEPGYDNFFRIIKYYYETATTTGLVTSWPVPGNKGVHFGWTYDIDAQDSYSLALVVAQDLQSNGIKGTINWQAKLVMDAYDVPSFTQYYRNISLVEGLGNMELASHSVSHSMNLLNFPIGTGKETYNTTLFQEDNYWPFIGQCINTTGAWLPDIPNATPCDTVNDLIYFYTVGGSLIGEIRVSKWILEQISIAGAQVVSYRTGHLLFPDPLPQLLVASGIKYDSSGATNDQNTHMPYQNFFNKDYKQEVDLMELTMTASDEDGQINGAWAAPGDATYPNGSYAYNQYQIIQQIAKYGGQYTFLIHPTTSTPVGVAPTLFSDKLAFQQTLNSKISGMVYYDTMSGRGSFQKARMSAGIDVSISLLTATITVTLPLPITDLTLRVPTGWAFVSSTVPVNYATKGAIILLNTVPAGTVTIKYNTMGLSLSPSSPATVAPPTTTTIAVASPTVPATPTQTNPLVIEDFQNPVRLNMETNKLGFYCGDDHSAVVTPRAYQDWLMLDVTTTTYWYTLLRANSCIDYSQYTRLDLSVRYPANSTIDFNLVLQNADPSSADCSVTGTRSIYSLTPNLNSTAPTANGWIHISVPLTSFVGVNMTTLQSLAVSGFASAGLVEINYFQFGF